MAKECLVCEYGGGLNQQIGEEWRGFQESESSDPPNSSMGMFMNGQFSQRVKTYCLQVQGKNNVGHSYASGKYKFKPHLGSFLHTIALVLITLLVTGTT